MEKRNTSGVPPAFRRALPGSADFYIFADTWIRRPGLCAWIKLLIMAVINSLAIGKSVKSAGNLTYKTVRGRCIASQRITQNKSNTNSQQIARNNFRQASKVITILQAWIDLAFEKSKYGSARNKFLKQNKLLLENTDMNTDFAAGLTGAGAWFQSMCNKTKVLDGSEPYFQCFAKGSASGVFVTTETAAGWTSNDQGCSSLRFELVSPILASEVRVGAVLFFEGSNSVVIKAPRSLTQSSGSYSEEINCGVTVTINSDDQGQTINYFFVDGYDLALKPSDPGASVYAIPVVFVRGKIVTLNKLLWMTIA